MNRLNVFLLLLILRFPGIGPVDLRHHVLHLLGFIIADGRLVFVEVVKIEVEDVGGALLLRITHAEHARPDLHALTLIVKDVSPLVALDDAAGLPRLDLVEEFAPVDSYLAHEKLVQIEGG